MKDVKALDRMAYLDVLRIFAAFSVVMLHSAAQFWYTLDIRSTEWLIANSYDAVFRFGVPVFMMISGAVFLNPNYKVDVKRLYTHNIFRLAVIYIVWSCAYGLFDCIWLFGIKSMSIKEILREMISGRYHLWFLPMIIGVYVLLPILKGWLERAEKKDVKYFIVMFLLLQVGVETLRTLTVSDEIHSILDLTKVELVCGYVGYFVWGYYLAHVGIGAKWRKRILAGAIPAVGLNIVLGCVLTRKAGLTAPVIYDSFGVFTFIIATSLFLICKNKITHKGGVMDKVVSEISAGTLGVYLMHIGVMEFTMCFGFHSKMMPNIVGIPIYAIACFAGCLLISAILRRIPFVGRYIC